MLYNVLYLTILYTFIYYYKPYVRASQVICWGSQAILRWKQKIYWCVWEARYCMYFIYKLEFKKIATSCALGFAIMGGIGYIVKLLFIPINNIILSWFHYFIITIHTCIYQNISKVIAESFIFNDHLVANQPHAGVNIVVNTIISIF